ncbi:HET-domain-containing protein, partial [Hyaloscypha variabilis F]
MVSEASYDQTRQWLQYCYSHHEQCATSKTSFLPTRVIDVGGLDGVPRLVELKGHPSHYAALSYCWGGDQSVKAKERNIKDFYTQLPVSKLQQTLKDAISTTRALGLQFLWIDSLCIIQDSEDDKIKELSRMHEVYANAYVTIVAANATDCNEGFLQRRIQLPDDPATVNFEAFSLPYRLQDGSFDEPVNVRAWTLQENLLSPRLLIYGSQLVRECYSGPSPEFGIQRKLPPSDPDSAKHLQQLQWYWSEVVGDYSERQLTNVNDKLIAISGIARQLSTTAFKDHSYKAGLWLPNSPNKTSFLYDLCWTTNSPSATQQASYLAPSWSWAS